MLSAPLLKARYFFVKQFLDTHLQYFIAATVYGAGTGGATSPIMVSDSDDMQLSDEYPQIPTPPTFEEDAQITLLQMLDRSFSLGVN